MNCNRCKNLNMTEEQQKRLGTKEPHICLKYGRRVFHRTNKPGFHDMIYPCPECEQEKSLSDSDRKGRTSWESLT